MVWCGVVWSGVVWSAVVWCGVVWCGVVWCGVVWLGVLCCAVLWCGVMWCGVVRCGEVWCVVVWCGVVWSGMLWCGVVWCGVDLFGPFNLKFGRNKSTKAWGALITCATVRQIHLEIRESPSSESFLQALRRFVSHHGWPTTIISDNGKSFVGAEKELKVFVEGRKKMDDFAVLHKLCWIFTMPLSPH